MRRKINVTSGPPIRPRCTRALGSNPSTHDASRLGCREPARCVPSCVTHAISEFVALRDTSPRCFAFRVALHYTPDRQSEQLGPHEWWHNSRWRRTAPPPKVTKYA